MLFEAIFAVSGQAQNREYNDSCEKSRHPICEAAAVCPATRPAFHTQCSELRLMVVRGNTSEKSVGRYCAPVGRPGWVGATLACMARAAVVYELGIVTSHFPGQCPGC